MKYRVFNIKWDIDDGEASTPSEMFVDVPAEEMAADDIEQYLTDEISNITGWCHEGYEFELAAWQLPILWYNTNMNIFHVSYRWSGGWGAYQEYEFIVVAETADKAIGMALQNNPRTEASKDCWSATEIPTNTELVYQVSSASS